MTNPVSTERAGGEYEIRPAAVAAVCGIVLLAGHAADVGGRLGDGVAGALLARSDAAAVVVLVLGTVVVAAPTVHRVLDGAAPIPWAAHLTRWLVPLYAVWIPIVIVDLLAVHPARTWRSVLATLVAFRTPRGAPLAGLTIGPVLTVLAITIVAVALLERVAALRGGRERLLAVATGAVVAGLAVRTVLVVGGWTAPFGALSWWPAHLDAVGAGLAIVTLRATGWPANDVRLRRAGVGVAAVAIVIAALVLPSAALLTGGGDVWWRGLLYVVAAAGVVVAVPVRGGGRPSACFAVAAPGLLLAGELAFIVLSRQHPDALTQGPLGARLAGPVLPTFLWSTIIAAGIGVLLTVVVLVPLGRRLRGSWPRAWYPLALSAVVAFGLMVRVVTWLRVAPPKTDAGDPRWYHVTANLLAAGRGFLEPLRWLDAQARLPSALHGPLYPMVLSVSSRLGGTTYVDHKFVSILIGTATVLVTALVAGRLAGRRAALIAGTLAALYPNLWLIDSLMFPEGLFALLTTLCILVSYMWRDRPRWALAALLGALIGLAGLTRGEGLLLGPLLAVPWILGHRGLAMRVRWRQLLVSGCACLIVVLPWTVRNATSFEAFVPISSNSNELVMYANCPDTYSGWMLGYWSYDCQQRYRAAHGDPPGDEAQQSIFWRDLGVDYARDHLSEVPKVVAARVLRQWELFRPAQTADFAAIENRVWEWSTVGLFAYYALLAGSIAGAVVLHRRGRRLLPLMAQALSVTITAAYAYGTVRFRAPVEPVLCVLAGSWLATIRVRARTTVPTTAPAVT
jgi:hypothetical protein